MINKANSTKNTKNTKKKKKNTAVLIAIAVILCIAISAAYAYMKGWFNPEITPTPSQSQSEEPSISTSPPPSETVTETETPTDSPIIENPIPEGHIKIDKFDDLKGYFEYLLSTKTGIYGLSVLDVTDNKSFNISSSQQFDNSSVYKIAVVMYAYEPDITTRNASRNIVEYTANDYDKNSDVVA